VALAESAVFGHVPPGLPHEPDRRGVYRFSPASLEKPTAGVPQ